MGQAIPRSDPAVVLRSHYKLVRALLAIAIVAVVGLSIAVVILASQEDLAGDTSWAQPTGHIAYGGFNPATGRPGSAPMPQRAAQTPATGSRSDGAPDEATQGPVKEPS
jgi:hypothetical protein